jgi:transcriptional regulator with PAS, ATPase and Fis domain
MVARKGPAFIGISPGIRDVLREIERAALTDTKVMITGESGVGKEIAARLVHEQSRRATLPLVTINCAGIPDSLLESELFGHVRGSFTGAFRDRSGLLELAQGGSVFLDEVGEMSLRLQATLLRFLETGEIQRVGSDSIQARINVRVIAATNRNLLDRIASREFREDLYYRLNVINIVIPPLRARREDIPVLLHHFFDSYAEDHGTRRLELSPDALARLVAYDWPGNVRQLRNIAERILVRARSPQVTAADLPPEISETSRTDEAPALSERPVVDVLFDRMVRGRESFWMVPYAMFMARDITRSDMREIIEKGLRQTGGNYKDLPTLFNIPSDDYKRLLSFLRQHKCHVPFQPFRRIAARTPPAAVAARRPSVQRRWPRKQISGVVQAQLASAEARVLDMSYGGFKLALAGQHELPPDFDVTLPTAGITVRGHRAWTSASPVADEFWCGVELTDIPTDLDWRAFVDSTR